MPRTFRVARHCGQVIVHDPCSGATRLAPVGCQNVAGVADLQCYCRHWSRSCGSLVFVDQPAEDIPALYPRCRQVGDQCWSARVVIWWPQVPGPVRAMLVIVPGVLVQDRPQVPRPGDQHPVGDLGPDGADPSLGIAVAPHRQLHPIRMIGTGLSG
jgi:hypothetical protein